MLPFTCSRQFQLIREAIANHTVYIDPNGIPRIGTPAWKTHVDRKRTLDVERHGSLATEGSDETKVAGEKGEEKVERTSDEVGKY
jgi:predicted RNA polymerase sigma factor